MSRRPLLALLVFSILLLAAYASAQGNRPTGAGGNAGANASSGDDAASARARADGEARDWQNLSAERREAGRQRAEAAGLFSFFRYEGGTATGRFVSFSYNAEHGTITNYSVGAGNRTMLLQAVELDATLSATPTVTGSVFRSIGDELSVSAHNNPTGQLHFRALNNSTLTVTFVLPEDANVTEAANGNGTRTMTLGNQSASFILTGPGNLTVSGGNVVAELGPGAGVVFLARPDAGGVRAAAHEAHVEAIASGRLGGVLSVVSVDGQPVADQSNYGVQMRAAALEQRSARLVLDSENATGRAVVVNLEASILDNATATEVDVTLDNETLRRASSLDEVLNAAGGLSTAADASAEGMYHVSLTNGVTQVTVHVPHFSERTLVISSSTSDATTGDGTTGGDTTGGGTTTGGDTTNGDGTTAPTGDGATGGTDSGSDTPGVGAALLLLVVAAAALGRSRVRRS